MRSIIENNNASAVPVMLYVMTLIVCGALYSLLFYEIGIPTLSGFIPASDSKLFIMMLIYAIPLFILIVGTVSLLKAGLKRVIGV